MLIIRSFIRKMMLWKSLSGQIQVALYEPYLKKVEVVLLGEKPEDAISLPAYLRKA